VSLRTLPAETSRPSRNNKRTSKRYEAIFDGYNNLGTYSQAFDEMFDGQGNVRGPYKGIFAELSPSDASDLEARAEALGRAFTDQGITFSLSGQERPFPLDLVPRVISAAEWTRLERGITQRVKALEHYLDDIYGEQEILRDGVIPRRLVTPVSTSIGRPWASSLPTASASTSPGSTSSGTLRATSGCSRTTCARRRACRT